MKVRVMAAVGGILLLGSALLGQAQQQKGAQVKVEGHFYETAKLEPKDEYLAALKMPAGFRLNKFAELSNPRVIAVADDGTVYATQREPGTLTMLRDQDGDGVAETQKVIVERKQLHGVAVQGNKIYLVTVKEVITADRKPDGTLGELRTIINDLPDGGQHPNRTLAIGPDGMLYITVGSTCNACKETNDENATVLRARADGTERKIFASGLRNTIGFGWHPASRRLFGFDHGIDWLGDEDQPEELNEIIEGARYGWPYVYANSKIYPHGQPPPGFTKEGWAKLSKEPLAFYTPHAAPMQMAFYTGNQFPAEYRNDAFVTMRGSWNRNPPSGYEIARVRFDKNGQPSKIEAFISGFLIKGGAPDGKDGHIARLVGLAVARDGALLVSDDNNNTIYRIAYDQKRNDTRAELQSIFPRVVTALLGEMPTATAITVSSSAFSNNGVIPLKYSAYGDDISPALKWSGAPAGTKSFALMVEDPDAMNPKPFVHWLAANIPADVTEIAEALQKTEVAAALKGAQQGANHTSKTGWYGPRPPAGDPPHRYHFQVFALDKVLTLPTGFNRQALLAAMKGHVLAKGMVIGTFQRSATPDAQAAKK